MLVPVLGYVAHVLAALFDVRVRDVMPAELYAPAGDLVEAGEAADELRLAVAVYAGDADNLAAAHVEADAAHRVALVQVARHLQAAHLEHGVRGLGRALVDDELDGASDHHVRELLLVRVLRVDRADALAAAEDGDAVGDLHNLIELVRDEEDALALAGELAHRRHELLNLLRGEDGGRLVEYEYLVVAVEHLQNLHALLHTDGDVLHLGVEVDLEAVALGELLHALAGLLLLDEAQLRRLRAEDDVVQHREHVDELEVLMHHAYVQGRGVVGVLYPDLLAVLLDDALLRLVEPEQHAHKRALARAVLAQQGVNLAAPELKRYVVVGNDARELLGDVEHLNDVFRLCSHRTASPFC